MKVLYHGTNPDTRAIDSSLKIIHNKHVRVNNTRHYLCYDNFAKDLPTLTSLQNAVDNQMDALSKFKQYAPMITVGLVAIGVTVLAASIGMILLVPTMTTVGTAALAVTAALTLLLLLYGVIVLQVSVKVADQKMSLLNSNLQFNQQVDINITCLGPRNRQVFDATVKEYQLDSDQTDTLLALLILREKNNKEYLC